jgi:replicative DNA helicase
LNATTIINAPDYANQVRDLYQRREMIRTASELIDRAAGDEPLINIVADAEATLHAVTTSARNERDVITIGEAAIMAVESANTAHMRGNSLAGMTTGISAIDHATGGLSDSDLIILAGRPSMGKTALVSNIGNNISRGYNSGTGEFLEQKRVGMFSLEMSAEQIGVRGLSEVSGISSSAMRTGRFSPDEMRLMMRRRDDMADVPLFIDQSGGLTIAQLSTRARRMKRKQKIDILIIDYLQLMGGNGRGGGNRVQEITEITTGLKSLAKELQIPIVALSQLSREVEKRADKRPQLSDLRESGSIEQDADVVMFVYREEYYVERAKPDPTDYQATQNWKDSMMACQGRAELIIGKQRHGATGTINLRFDAKTTTFRDGAAS